MLIAALVIFFIFMFFLFVFIFRKVINKNISSAVQHLDEINKEYLKKEEEAEEKLKEAERVYQETVSKAKEEALSLRDDILKQTQKEKEEIIREAKNQAKEIVSQAEKTRHLLISELEERIDKEATKKASLLLSEVLSLGVREIIHQNLLKEFKEGLSQRIAGLQVPSDLKEAKIVSSFELGKEEEDFLVGMIREKCGSEIKIITEIDPKLLAGVMIVLGSLIIDGTLKFQIEERIKEIIGKKS